MSVKAIAVVSDLHCGSIYGLLPPNFTNAAEAPVHQNPLQQFLWECWEYYAAQLKRYDVAAVIVNGDAIDGAQQAQKQTELCLPLLSDQSRAAVDCLQVLLMQTPKAAVYFTAGTPYHSQPGAREEEAIAKALNARKYHGLGTGIYVRESLDLDVDGVVLNFAHHIGVTGGIYRGTAIDREALFAALAGREGKYQRSDCIVRSHAHFFYHAELPHRHAVITPCWQLQTQYMRRRSLYRMLPDIGGIILLIDPEAKKQKEDAVTVKKVLFPLPPTKVTKL